MATFIKAKTQNPWLIRVQLSFEQNAVFEWCANNLGIGKMDDRETILKLLEPHYEAYQKSLSDQPKTPITTITAPTSPTHQPTAEQLERREALLQINHMVKELNALVLQQRNGTIDNDGMARALELTRLIKERKEELGID